MGSLSYEKQLISSIIQDPTTMMRKVQRSRIQPKHLSGKPERYFLSKFMELTGEGSEITLLSVTETVLHDIKLDKKIRQVYVNIAEDYSKAELDSVNFSINFLTQKRKDYELERLLNDSFESYSSDESSKEVLESMMLQIKRINTGADSYELTEYTSEEQWESRKAKRLQTANAASSSIQFYGELKWLAKYFPRGFEAATITNVGGNTGVGKSMLLNNIARIATMPPNSLNGLYIISENKKILTESRLDATFLNRKYDRLYLKNLEKDEAGDNFFKDSKKNGYGKLFTAKVTIKKFDARTIETFLDEMIEMGCPADFVIIDSPDHMLPSESSMITHEKKALVYEDIKALCDEKGGYNIPFITSLPMKASAAKLKKVSAEDAGGAYAISQIADNQIFFYKSEEDIMLGRRRCEIVKIRDGFMDGEMLYLKLTDELRFVDWEEGQKTIADIGYSVRHKNTDELTVVKKTPFAARKEAAAKAAEEKNVG